MWRFRHIDNSRFSVFFFFIVMSFSVVTLEENNQEGKFRSSDVKGEFSLNNTEKTIAYRLFPLIYLTGKYWKGVSGASL